MKSKSKQENTLLSFLLLELWENAPFNDESYLLLQKFAEEKITEIQFFTEAQNILSTIRNRNLISYDQQNLLQDQVVGFFGLSVGSHAALTWMMESRARSIKIIDPDVISPSNLNRLRFGWETVGQHKVQVVSEELKNLNPDLQILSTTNIDPQDIEKIFTQTPKLTAVVDAIDDMESKILLRRLAKANKIPLVSAADVGDNVVLDIERYDLDPQPEPFLGRVSNILEIDFKNLSSLERKKLIIRLVGFEENSLALLNTLLSLGKSVTTWPQLGATATMAGGIIATSLKKIFLKENIQTGRYYMSLDNLLVQDNNEKLTLNEREEKVLEIKKKFML